MREFAKWALGFFAVLFFVSVLIPVTPPDAPVAASESARALTPVLRTVAKVAAPQPSARTLADDSEPTVQPLSDESQEAFAEMNLQQLERIREIPGAAPLLDDILEYLKMDIQETVSLDNIPADEHGLAVLDDEAIELMIPDAALRAKWEKLMAMVEAQNAQ